MNKLLSLMLFISLSSVAHAGQTRQFMTCAGSEMNGQKIPFAVQAYILNSKQIEGLKIQYKKYVYVNELSRVAGEPYSDGIINNHLIFKAKTDRSFALVLPVNFRMTSQTHAFLAQSKGDDTSFTALNCQLQ